MTTVTGRHNHRHGFSIGDPSVPADPPSNLTWAMQIPGGPLAADREEVPMTAHEEASEWRPSARRQLGSGSTPVASVGALTRLDPARNPGRRGRLRGRAGGESRDLRRGARGGLVPARRLRGASHLRRAVGAGSTAGSGPGSVLGIERIESPMADHLSQGVHPPSSESAETSTIPQWVSESGGHR